VGDARFFRGLFVLAVVWAAAGCSRGSEARPGVTSPPVRLRLATTTSTDNSGLLEAVLPAFERAHNIKVDVIPVGTGKALKLGERGDVDVVLVHAPEAEKAFVAAGYGVDRRYVMYNDFVLLGPAHDPAGVRGVVEAAEVFRLIGEAGAPFVSRGDDSGTHRKEMHLWSVAGVSPSGPWYIEAGQGMGATLTMADEKRAYTLSDRGTYLTFKDKMELVPVFEEASELANPYHVILVNRDRHPHVHFAEAGVFADWLTSAEAQDLIGAFRKHGEVLFHPAKEAGLALSQGSAP